MGRTILTEMHHAWVRDALSADPESYASPTVPTNAAAPAAAPANGTPATAMTPDEARADLERRLAKSGSLYAKSGPGADDILKEEDRLSPAELQVGKVTVARTGDTALNGKDSKTTVDEKGVTTSSTASVTQGEIGADGKVATFSHEQTKTTNYGLGNKTESQSTKTTTQASGVTTVDGASTTKSIDLLKGETSSSTSTSSGVTDANTGASTQASEKNTVTKGVSGYNETHEESRQTGQQFDSKSTTVGVTRADGQIGIGASQTTKSGTMAGPADKQAMKTGTETTVKGGIGVVSDGSGVGIGATGGVNQKHLMGDGLSLTNTVGGGGRCQALVAEVPNSNPPEFTITTMISFDLSIGVGGGKEGGPKPGESADGQAKGSVSVSLNTNIGSSASFKRKLGADEAKIYLDGIRDNGRGGKLPEHQILATGMSQGWQAAAELWAKLGGGAAQAKILKSGEEIETSSQAGATGKIGVSGGEAGAGGITVGADYAKSVSHKVDIKKTGLADGRIQVTATIDDQTDTAVGGSVSVGVVGGKAGSSHGDGSGQSVVLILDPKGPKFDAIISEIEAARSADELKKVAAAHKDAVASSTAKTSSSNGTSVGATIGPASIDLGGKGAISNEVTTDGQGNVTGTKSFGTSQTGGTVGVGDLKIGDTKTDSYIGVVQDGKASGEIAETTTSTDIGKTLKNFATGMANDPLGTALHPTQAVASDTETKGIAIADAETMDICYAALNKAKWNGKCASPSRLPDWQAAGAKIRAAATVKDGEIVSVNKSAVQQALAEWTKGDDGKRAEVLESVVRPQGGTPGGKAEGFPDGTAQMKPEFDALVNADPLAGPNDKAKTDPQGALKDMQAVQARIHSLQSQMNTAHERWVDLETQFAEMIGNLNTRLNDVDKAIRELQASQRKTAKAATAQEATTSSVEQQAAQEAEAKAEKDQEYTEKVKGQLDTYNNNIDSLKHYSDTVFGKLGEAQAVLQKDGLFDNKIDNLVKVDQILKETSDLIKIWDGLYWKTFKMYDDLFKTFTNLDRSRLEKLHVAGAQGRWQEVHKLST